MTKSITCLIIISFFAMIVNAQSFYIKPAIGNGWEINTKYYNYNSIEYYEDDNSATASYHYESVKFSFGKGSRYGLSIGAEISKNIDLGVTMAYSNNKSPEIIASSLYTFAYEYEEIQTGKITELLNYQCKSFFLTPEIIFKTNNTSFSVVRPYLKIGAIIGFSTITEDYQLSALFTAPGYYPFQSTAYKLEYDLTTSLGFSTSAGLEYEISEEIYMYAEVNYIDLTCTPKKAKIIESSFMSQDNLDQLAYNEIFYEFVEDYYDYENFDIEQPTKSRPTQFSLSNINAMIGFKFLFRYR